MFLESNQRNSGMLKQHKFLTRLLETLNKEPGAVLSVLNKIRSTITNPSNLALYFAGNLDILKASVANIINDFLPNELKNQKKQKRLVFTTFFFEISDLMEICKLPNDCTFLVWLPLQIGNCCYHHQMEH